MHREFIEIPYFVSALLGIKYAFHVCSISFVGIECNKELDFSFLYFAVTILFFFPGTHYGLYFSLSLTTILRGLKVNNNAINTIFHYLLKKSCDKKVVIEVTLLLHRFTIKTFFSFIYHNSQQDSSIFIKKRNEKLNHFDQLKGKM